MTIDFEIIVGTYEQFLLGYKIANVEKIYTLERSFATHSHLASIRDVASSRHYLASAGGDDCVCLYDMRYRIESGRLSYHNGTVNCVTFTPDSSHIMTTSADGSIGVVRCGNWELEKHWKSAHKGSPVNALAIHPTGKLAMSVGGDGVLRTWNLVKGRQAYATNLVPRLKHEARDVSLLRWSPQGDRYVVASNRRLDVYAVETAAVSAELLFESKLVSLEFVRDDILAIGREDGRISFCDVAAGAMHFEDIVAHDTRVKCLACRDNYLVSGSSSGVIKLWRYGKKGLKILSETSCDARITCLTLAQLCANPLAKKEQTEEKPEIVEPKKKAFRVRREVVIEDEDDARHVRKRKKDKSARKREAEVATPEDQLDNEKLTKKTRTDKTSAKKIRKIELDNEKPTKKMRTDKTSATKNPEDQLDNEKPTKKMRFDKTSAEKNPEDQLDNEKPTKKMRTDKTSATKNPEDQLDNEKPAKKARTDKTSSTKNSDDQSTTKIKRNPSVDKLDGNPVKKIKRAKKVTKETAVSESENVDSQNGAMISDVATIKKKKKKRLETTSNEIIPEPDVKKRKIQNGISSACTSSPTSKPKKKKAAR